MSLFLVHLILSAAAFADSRTAESSGLAYVKQGLAEERSGNGPRARELYGKACTGRLTRGCSYLGNLEERAGNTMAAEALYKRACDGGDSWGCDFLTAVLEDRIFSGNP
jgi:hypothetical protein